MQGLVDVGEVLEDAECWSLVASRRIGRLAVTVEALPIIIPVKYMLSGKSVIFYGARYLRKALDRAVVALQVDDVDHDFRSVRSVTAIGVAAEVRAPLIEAAVTEAGLRPHSKGDGKADGDGDGDGDATFVVAVEVELLSGRRFVNW